MSEEGEGATRLEKAKSASVVFARDACRREIVRALTLPHFRGRQSSFDPNQRIETSRSWY
jgi:hypothetical protein